MFNVRGKNLRYQSYRRTKLENFGKMCQIRVNSVAKEENSLSTEQMPALRKHNQLIMECSQNECTGIKSKSRHLNQQIPGISN